MSMADRDGFIWHDGKLVPWRNATTHVLTHTLHYGMGVFEGVRAYKAEKGTAIFRLQEHTNRLFNSAYIFQMKMPWDKATIIEAQKEVVRANQLESWPRVRRRGRPDRGACGPLPLRVSVPAVSGVEGVSLEIHGC